MRKFKICMAVVLALILSFTGIVAGCSNETLAAPSEIDIDLNNNLTWTEVEGARNYKVEVTSLETGDATESSTRRTEYSLSGLAEGDYEIRIMALGGSQSSVVASPWSDVVPFHKDFETGLLYELVGGEYHIKRVGSASGSVTIEDIYRGKPVTAIDDAAFRASPRVTELIIGKNVVSIGENAFFNCTNLVSVTLPESLTSIGKSAFQGCRALKSLALPDGVTELYKNTFSYCRALEEVSFGSKLEYIGDSAFYECSELVNVELPDSVLYIAENAFSMDMALKSISFGSGLQYIGKNAFTRDSALENVTFSELDGELSIDSYAFTECDSLREIELPEGTVRIENYAFSFMGGLERISIPNSLTFMGANILNGSKLHTEQRDDTGFVYADKWLAYVSYDVRTEIEKVNGEVLQEGTRGIASTVFNRATNLERVDLPASVKYLGEGTFANCSRLFYVRSPENGLIKIDYSAFYNCGQLSRVLLNDGLEEIGSYAFYKCTVLNTSEFDYDGTLIPSTVKKVGRGAFEETLLWNYADDYGVIYAGDWVVGFDEYTLQSTVVLNPDVYGIADYAFYKAGKLQNIENLNRVERLGRGAFYLCTHLGTVRLNQNLDTILPFTFYKCMALYDLGMLPWNLQEIGDYAFYLCETLKSLDLYDTQVTRVGSHTFYGCSNLQTLYLNDGLEILDAYAFYRTSIHELTIPDSVTVLGERAFGKCYNLTSVSFGKGVEEIGEFAFRECAFLSKIVLPDSVKKVDDYAFYGCRGINSVTFGNSVEYIGKYAFAYAARLEVLDLPASLNYIGANAFKGCGVKAVTLHGPVSYVGQYAFYGTPMTMYTSAGISASWDKAWNEQFRTVVQNCTFDEEGGYLVSVRIEKDTVVNGFVWGGMSAPYRAGYEFVGWATAEGSSNADYALNDLMRVPAGTTLYAVWQAQG